MSYLTDNMLRNIVDVPVAMPSTRVTANKWIIVATVKVSGHVTAQFNWLLLQLFEAIRAGEIVELNDACNPANIGLVDANYGLAYVGIVKDLSSSSIDANNLQFIGTQADVLTVSERGVVSRDPENPLTIDSAGNYSFILINNCVDTDLRLLVSGMIRIDAT